jgi:hypothetical protein
VGWALSYYESPRDTKPKGFVGMHLAEVAVGVDVPVFEGDKGGGKAPRFPFDVTLRSSHADMAVCGDKGGAQSQQACQVLSLYAASERERTNWVKRLQAAAAVPLAVVAGGGVGEQGLAGGGEGGEGGAGRAPVLDGKGVVNRGASPRVKR